MQSGYAQTGVWKQYRIIMKQDFSKPYSSIADIYAHLMRYIDYEDWADYYIQIGRKYLPRNRGGRYKVLELASGMGNMAAYLKKEYPDFTASDLSADMLKHSADYLLPKVCCNMKHLPFKQEFDYIISAFDSLNYLVSEDDITAAFRQIHSVIAPDGLFSFDVSLELNSIRNDRHLNRKGKYEGIIYSQTSRYEKDTKLHINGFHLTYPDGSEAYEIHKQKIYPFETFFRLLSDTGFNIKYCFDAFTFDDAHPDSERIQFIATKGR